MRIKVVSTCQLLRTQHIFIIAIIILISFALHLCVPLLTLSYLVEFSGCGCQFQGWSAHLARVMVSTLSSCYLLNNSRSDANRNLSPAPGRVGRGPVLPLRVCAPLQHYYGRWQALGNLSLFSPLSISAFCPVNSWEPLWLECLIIWCYNWKARYKRDEKRTYKTNPVLTCVV